MNVNNSTLPEKAMFQQSLPCNPIPFANRIIELVKENGTDFIKSDECKACLFILNSLSYNQLFSIDSITEYGKLDKSLNQ